ncbi:MAG TPA: KinB-signaling pathway activation protein [Bacillales bacterium]|nr:KinB-signaling pathway activation protein [Bacillales bacterium]
MTIRRWLYLFLTTLLIGGVLGLVLGLVFNWHVVTSGGFLNLFFGALELFGFGCMFSVISQMGFFAYLTIHRVGLVIFRSFWDTVLIVLTAFVLFDLFYFRMLTFRGPGESIVGYILVPLLLLIISWAVAYQKKKETNRHAFVPTLFFMVVITSLEWYYPLKTDSSWMWTVIVVLLACNAWQVLLLHRLIQSPKKN